MKNKHKHRKSSSKVNSEHFANLFEKNINFRERVIYLNNEIDDSSLDIILKAFDEFERGEKPGPIKIEISSYGGSVYDMLGIIGRIKSSPCHIITRGFGKIMSAATLILAAGDERYMDRYAWMMLHEMSDSIRGKMSEIKVDVKHAQEVQNQLYDLYEDFSNRTTKASVFERLCNGKDHYIDAEAALKLGLIDKIIS